MKYLKLFEELNDELWYQKDPSGGFCSWGRWSSDDWKTPNGPFRGR